MLDPIGEASLTANTSEKQQSKFLERIAEVKELIGIIWSLALVFAIILLIALPEWLGGIVGDRLSRAGVTKLKIAGFEFERGLEKSTEKLEQALQRIAALENERDILDRSISEVQADVTDSVLKKRLAELRSEMEVSSHVTDSFQESLESTIIISRDLLDQQPQETISITRLQEAYCYQEDRLKDGPDRYSVHCHAKKDVCEKARGPSKVRKQTPCELTDLSTAKWKPASPGWLGSTYQFSRSPLPAPFPQLLQ